MGAFDHLEWTYDGAFEQLFGLGRGEFEQKFCKKYKCLGVARGGGMLKLRFDWYISYGKRLWPSAAGATCYLARKPPQEEGSREPLSNAGRTTTQTFFHNSEPHFKTPLRIEYNKPK